MRFFKKTMVVSLSLAAFVFMLPFEFIQGVVKKVSGKDSSVRIVSELYAEVFYTIEEALMALLPGNADLKEEVKVLTEEQKKTVQEKAKVELNPEFDKEFHFYVSSSGIAVLDTVKGKWGPIKFMMAFDTAGKIKDIVVLELKERRGRPVKERKFLGQYVEKSISDPIKLNKDIKGIAGATISSRQMTDGVRKLVYVFNELYKK